MWVGILLLYLLYAAVVIAVVYFLFVAVCTGAVLWLIFGTHPTDIRRLPP